MGCSGSKSAQPSSFPSIQPSSNPSASSGINEFREAKISVMFKAKRANVFTKGFDDSEENPTVKNIAKTAQQEQVIRKALESQFIFTEIGEHDTKVLVNAMEPITVQAGETIIKQGEKAEGQGAYFYIIEKGSVSVIVNNKAVGKLNDGKSFGELALLHHTPRAATITSDTATSLFRLDRDTFRFIVHSSENKKNDEVFKALQAYPLFSGLTDKQLHKVADAVEVIIFKAGEKIITKGDTKNVDIFYMIKEGSVRVSELGNGFADHSLSAGSYFGERALMTGDPRAATVTAETRASCMCLDRTAFNTLLGPLIEVLDNNMNMRILTTIKLFEKLTEAEKVKVAKSFDAERFKANTEIIKQGDKGRKFYIIKEGSAQVTADGKVIAELKAGSYFGEMALMNDEVRAATITTITDCECFSMDRPAFNKIMNIASLDSILHREAAHREEILKGAGPSDAVDEQLNYSFTDLKDLAVLGSGTFGRVTLVQDKQDKTKVYALKAMLKSEIVLHKQQSNVMNEKNVMIICNHPFVLRLYQTFKDTKRLYMLLEFVQGGELFTVLHTPQGDGVPEASAKFYAAGVILALAYLHSKEIAYRDMKPENCLVDRDGYPKLVDFGFAKVIQGKSYTLCGTPEYLAPELVLGKGHNKAVDYWAFGILLYEMVAGHSPFSDPSGNGDQVVICRNIVNGTLTFPKAFNNSHIKTIITVLLNRDLTKRLGNLRAGADEIKTQKWFDGFDFDAYMKKQIKAPWKPKVKDVTDVSHFEAYGAEDHKENPNFRDTGNWDKDF